MIAEVEKRVEGSLIERLEGQVSKLTQALEAGDEERDGIKFEREYFQKEIDKLKIVSEK